MNKKNMGVKQLTFCKTSFGGVHTYIENFLLMILERYASLSPVQFLSKLIWYLFKHIFDVKLAHALSVKIEQCNCILHPKFSKLTMKKNNFLTNKETSPLLSCRHTHIETKNIYIYTYVCVCVYIYIFIYVCMYISAFFC